MPPKKEKQRKTAPRKWTPKKESEAEAETESQKIASKEKAQYSAKKTGMLRWPPAIHKSLRFLIDKINAWSKAEELPPHIANNRITKIINNMEKSLNPEQVLIHEIQLFEKYLVQKARAKEKQLKQEPEAEEEKIEDLMNVDEGLNEEQEKHIENIKNLLDREPKLKEDVKSIIVDQLVNSKINKEHYNKLNQKIESLEVPKAKRGKRVTKEEAQIIANKEPKPRVRRPKKNNQADTLMIIDKEPKNRQKAKKKVVNLGDANDEVL